MKLIIVVILLGAVGCASTQTQNLLYNEDKSARKCITIEDYLPPKETCKKA